ncbi:hypothetical protein ACLOJK_011030 [Asimina triloba]
MEQGINIGETCPINGPPAAATEAAAIRSRRPSVVRRLPASSPEQNPASGSVTWLVRFAFVPPSHQHSSHPMSSVRSSRRQQAISRSSSSLEAVHEQHLHQPVHHRLHMFSDPPDRLHLGQVRLPIVTCLEVVAASNGACPDRQPARLPDLSGHTSVAIEDLRLPAQRRQHRRLQKSQPVFLCFAPGSSVACNNTGNSKQSDCYDDQRPTPPQPTVRLLVRPRQFARSPDLPSISSHQDLPIGVEPETHLLAKRWRRPPFRIDSDPSSLLAHQPLSDSNQQPRSSAAGCRSENPSSSKRTHQINDARSQWAPHQSVNDISSGPHINQSVNDINNGPHISQSVGDIGNGPHISQSIGDISSEPHIS